MWSATESSFARDVPREDATSATESRTAPLKAADLTCLGSQAANTVTALCSGRKPLST